MDSSSGTIKVRLDKYLWAIRVFKTRSLAMESIQKGKVTNSSNQNLKASCSVKANDVFTIEISKEYTRIIKVIDLLENRLSAEKARSFYEELSLPREKKEVLPSVFYSPPANFREKKGRPTKKNRRSLGNIGYF